MHFRRKIDEALRRWRREPARGPLLVDGLTGSGKTTAVLAFAKANVGHTVYVNCSAEPRLARLFHGATSIDQLVTGLSAELHEPASFVPGDTVIVLDDVDPSQEVLTALRLFKADGRYDVIAVSSLAWESFSISSGEFTRLRLLPMDFEEFLWAHHFPESALDLLRESIATETPVPEPLHSRLQELFLTYAVVGGMPAAVETFLETHNLGTVRDVQLAILDECQRRLVSVSRQAGRKDLRAEKIRRCWDAIPMQLEKANKKFQYALLEKGARAGDWLGVIDALETAGLVTRCRRIGKTALPLEETVEDGIFKLYSADIGLFMAMLKRQTTADVLFASLSGGRGAVAESLVADLLSKAGVPFFYFRKASGLELPFLIDHQGHCVPLEFKAKDGNAKSLKTVLRERQTYHLDRAIKVGLTNIERSGSVLSIPFYALGFFPAFCATAD